MATSKLTTKQLQVLNDILRRKKPVRQRKVYTRKSEQRTPSGKTLYSNMHINALLKKGYLVENKLKSTSLEKVLEVRKSKPKAKAKKVVKKKPYKRRK